MNPSYLFSLPSGLAEYDGVKKLLADAAAFPVEERTGSSHNSKVKNDTSSAAETSAVDVPHLFCGCDPEGAPLGSGGGTVHLLHASYLADQGRAPAAHRTSFASWLRLGERRGRVIVHAGGLSRRLPAYATLGKALLPLPPCRWHRGSSLRRTLLSTQVPLYQALMSTAPFNLRTLIACGDICLHVKGGLVPSLAQFTDTDVLCVGLRTSAQLLQQHGVFFMSRQRPSELEFMLQKPSLAEVRRCAAEGDRTYLLDVGLWLLSERAVEVLARKCMGSAFDRAELEADARENMNAPAGQSGESKGTVVQTPYDLYAEFGAALGTRCLREDAEVTALKARVLEIPAAEFLHYGTNRQLISSTQTLQACEAPTPSWSWQAPFDGLLVRERSELGNSCADFTDEVQREGGRLDGTLDKMHDLEVCDTDHLHDAPRLDFTSGDALPLLAAPSSVIVHNSVVLSRLDGMAAASGATANTATDTSTTTGSNNSTSMPAVATAAAESARLSLPRQPVKHLWVESSWIGAQWTLRGGHVLTGIPRNNWSLDLPQGICVNVVPVVKSCLSGGGLTEAKATPYAARPYHIDDTFRGDVHSTATVFMGVPLHIWLTTRGFTVEELYCSSSSSPCDSTSTPLDIYDAKLFPVCATAEQLGDFLHLATLPAEAVLNSAAAAAGQRVWRTQPRVSAMDLLRLTDVPALLCNSAFYERRMLTLTMALVARGARRAGGSASSPSTSYLPEAGPESRRPSVLSPPMVAQLQQQFFLLDLDSVARRMVELKVALPASSSIFVDEMKSPAADFRLTDGTSNDRRHDTSDADVAQEESTLNHHEHHSAKAESGNNSNSSSISCSSKSANACGGLFSHAHFFADDETSSLKAPASFVSPHLVAAHFHTFMRRVIELQLLAIQAEPHTSSARLRLLHATSVAHAESLVARHDAAAFAELRAALMSSYPNELQSPRLGVHLDQIIWGRSPIRLDIAGGWTDTPPYTLLEGGSVINVAVELNGQPPVQVYVRVRRDDPTVVIHSIDSGARAVLTDFDAIRSYATVQNPFSIPKAALALCGFLPEFCTTKYNSLAEQLRADFGGHGLEISLLVAVPTGSGLGTSSIVSGAVLRSLAEFCCLRWDEHTVCRRVLLMEQMLTAGGGWQDQYGGLFGGLKLVQSVPGLPAVPTVRWMPANLFTDPRFAACHVLYYTGITRVAKSILSEVVRSVFLNNGATLGLLREMGGPHTSAMYDAITMLDYEGYARLVQRTWDQKKKLDGAVTNPQVEAIVARVSPYVLGLVLPGAGGGGYLYMCAKNEACARQIREVLTANPPNPYARFVDMTVSTTGMQVSRS